MAQVLGAGAKVSRRSASVAASWGPVTRVSPTKNVGVPSTPLRSPLWTSAVIRETWRPSRMCSAKRSRSSPIAWASPSRSSSSSRRGARRPGRASPRTGPARRRLDGLRGELGARVVVGERQVTEDEAQASPKRSPAARPPCGRLAAEGALEVAVLHQRQRGVGRPRIRSRPRRPAGDSRGAVRRHRPRRQRDRRAGRARQPSSAASSERDQHADLRLVLERCVVEGEVGDEQRDGEADARRAPRRRPAGRPDAARQPPSPRRAAADGAA